MLLPTSARRRTAPPPVGMPASPTSYTLATPDGTGRTVHPSVVDMVAETGSPLSGFRWWMANTPYPPDDQENPCIWASNDRVTWVVPPGVSNPIAPYPGAPLVSSDTEMVWDPENSRLVLWWRTYGLNPIQYNAATSVNGQDWTLLGTLHTWPTGTSRSNQSPAVARKASGDWRWWALGGAPIMFTGPTALGPWSEVGDCDYQGITAYHGDIIRYEGHWLCIASDGGNRARPGISVDDGMTWEVGPDLGLGYSYRPTMLASTLAGYLDVWNGRPGEQYWRVPASAWLDLLPS